MNSDDHFNTSKSLIRMTFGILFLALEGTGSSFGQFNFALKHV
jgi:hypothetical protein